MHLKSHPLCRLELLCFVQSSESVLWAPTPCAGSPPPPSLLLALLPACQLFELFILWRLHILSFWLHASMSMCACVICVSYTCACKHVCMCVHLRAFACMCLHVCACVCMCVHLLACACTCMHGMVWRGTSWRATPGWSAGVTARCISSLALMR